jgi:hypothetical protein
MTDRSTPTRPRARYPARITRSRRLAAVGFVLALWGALSSFIPIVNLAGDLLAAVGVVFAISALVRSRRWGPGRALSIAAISLAVIALTVSIMVNIAATAVVSAFGTGPRALGTVDLARPAPARPAPARAHATASVATPAQLSGSHPQTHPTAFALAAAMMTPLRPVAAPEAIPHPPGQRPATASQVACLAHRGRIWLALAGTTTSGPRQRHTPGQPMPA